MKINVGMQPNCMLIVGCDYLYTIQGDVLAAITDKNDTSNLYWFGQLPNLFKVTYTHEDLKRHTRA